jgi:RNA polymerase sigma-70 factor (ECF subfamily)
MRFFKEAKNTPMRLLSNRKTEFVTEEELINGIRKGNRQAQKALYEKYSPVLFGLCRRYVKSYEDSEDVMVEGFYKIMSKIDQYTGKGNFEGWMKRIMVNESLMHIRKRHNMNMTVEIADYDMPKDPTIEQDLAAQDILDLLDKLPTGYRTVFNMYVIEGYKHREIAEILEISINTSKSQLILAKKRMKEMVEELGVQYFSRKSQG